MGGFKDESLNIAFESGVINLIIAHLIKCSKQMKADCAEPCNMLQNHEDKITNRLVAKYLNAEPNNFRYEIQSPENFDAQTDQYIGRADIKVISADYFKDSQFYYIIESKRIDGDDNLNKKYITDGIARFVINPPKYPSYHNQNIMFGYVVQAIDIPKNTEKIGALQASLLNGVTVNAFILVQNEDSQYFVYSCGYTSEHIRHIELKHIFYDFADVIQ